jgi:hypothetical protein
MPIKARAPCNFLSANSFLQQPRPQLFCTQKAAGNAFFMCKTIPSGDKKP